MAINKYSVEEDKLANLYRAAYYLGSGAVGVGLELLAKTKLDFPEMDLDTENDQKYWAEKILDKYFQLKIAQH
jgi:hypothetical protein